MTSFNPTVKKTEPIKEYPGYIFNEMSVAEHLWFTSFMRYLGACEDEGEELEFSLFHLKTLLVLLSIEQEGEPLVFLKASEYTDYTPESSEEDLPRLKRLKDLGFENTKVTFYHYLDDANKNFCDLCYSKYIAEADNVYFDLGEDLKKK